MERERERERGTLHLQNVTEHVDAHVVLDSAGVHSTVVYGQVSDGQ